MRSTGVRYTLTSVSLFLLLGYVACAQKDCKRPDTPVPPACGDDTKCPEGHARVCIDKCKRLAAEGERCDRDPCAEGQDICNANLACVDNVCKPAKRLECQIANLATEPCADNAFCRSAACPPPENWTTNPGEICAAFTGEGKPCDGDWSDVAQIQDGRTLCSPCEPGTMCVKAPGETAGTCRRSCDEASLPSQCPCGNYRCVAATEPAGMFCDSCAPTGSSCKEGDRTLTCCDAPDAICKDDRCCRPTGATCTGQGQCCGTDRCDPGGLCVACKTTGEAASDQALCCDGLVLKNVAGKNVCTPQCGGAGQPCCQQSWCDAGNVCSGETCQPCGAMGSSCCPGNECSAGVCFNNTCQSCVPQTFKVCVCPSTGQVAEGTGCTMKEVRDALWAKPPQGACGIYVDGPCPSVCDGKQPVQVTMCCAKWPVEVTQWACTAEEARNAIRSQEPSCDWKEGPCA